MTVHLYFARKFVWIILGLTTVFFILMTLVDLMEHLRRFDVEKIGFSEVLRLTLLNGPKGLYQIVPLIIILATITLFLSLSRSSELVVVRATGRPALVTLLAPVGVAALIGLLSVTMFNPIVAATTERYNKLSDRLKSGNDSVFSISSEGLWMRQGSAAGQSVIHAQRASSDGSQFYDVTIVSYATGSGPVVRVEASRAELLEGAWRLTNAKEWPVGDGLNSEARATLHDELTVDSTLTLDRIRNSFGAPSAVSVWNLPRFISELQEAGFSSRRHKVWLHMELAQPLFLIAMVLIASAFTMRHSRFGRTGLSVLAAVLLGFLLYYVRNFAQILGENGQINVFLAAWAPPVASVMLALGLLLHMEDG